MKDESGAVLQMPKDFFTFLKIHGLGQWGWEIDIPLIGAFSARDQLNFGWIAHVKVPPLLRN